MKPIKEKKYNWKFNKINSKGETLFKHTTDESVDYVIEFLENENIKYELTEAANSTMFWIYFKYNKYAYYSTTGRWAPFNKGKYPSKHYTSEGIKDFYNRFLLSAYTFKSGKETKKEVEKILKKELIEYKINKDVALLTTKIKTRKDGKGNKRRYSYEYIIGDGKWRSINSDGTPNEKFYQASSIENFITKYFRPQEEL